MLTTIVHPKTGHTLSILDTFVHSQGIWLSSIYSLTVDDKDWIKDHLNPNPLLELSGDFARLPV